MGSAPSPPPAPDPTAVGQAQTGVNVGTALANNSLNHVSQTDQFGDAINWGTSGDTTFNIDGKNYSIPNYTEQTTLGPGAQQLYNSTLSTQQNMANDANSLSQQAGAAISNPAQFQNVNLQQLGALPNADLSANNINKFVNTNWEQPFDNFASQQQEQLNQSLASQGILPGGSGGGAGPGGAGGTGNAYQNAQYNLGQNLQGQNSTYANAMYGTAAQNILASTQQQDQNLINENQINNQNQLQGAGFNNSVSAARQSTPINELSALLSQSQVQSPQFQNTSNNGNIATTDQAGIDQASYQDQLQAYQAQLAAQSAQQGGMFGAAGSVLGGLVKNAGTGAGLFGLL